MQLVRRLAVLVSHTHSTLLAIDPETNEWGEVHTEVDGVFVDVINTPSILARHNKQVQSAWINACFDPTWEVTIIVSTYNTVRVYRFASSYGWERDGRHVDGDVWSILLDSVLNPHINHAQYIHAALLS